MSLIKKINIIFFRKIYYSKINKKAIQIVIGEIKNIELSYSIQNFYLTKSNDFLKEENKLRFCKYRYMEH